MNTNQNPEKDPIDGLVRQWSVPKALPPGFQEQVWQRIAQANRKTTPSAWSSLWALLNEFLPRPTIAAAYLALILGLGVAAGSKAAQAKTGRLEAELGRRYVQSIDPYLTSFQKP